MKTTSRKLFDLEKDPGELHSLVKKRSSFSEALRQWALTVEKGLYNELERSDHLTENDLEMLRSLGYIE